jgi:hypothetical protein
MDAKVKEIKKFVESLFSERCDMLADSGRWYQYITE